MKEQTSDLCQFFFSNKQQFHREFIISLFDCYRAISFYFKSKKLLNNYLLFSLSFQTPQHLPRLIQHSIQLPAPCLRLCRVFAMFQGIHFRTLLALSRFHACRFPRFPPLYGFGLLFPLFLRPVFRHDLRLLIIRLNRFVFLHACA